MPDVEIRPQRYRDDRPKEFFDKYHARTRAGEPEAKVYEVKSQLFAPGPPQWIFIHGGVFPVRRGVQDEEAFITAYTILERGGTIGIRQSHDELRRLGHRGSRQAARRHAVA